MIRTTLIAAILFALVSLAHIVRILFKVDITIGGVSVPMWASVVGALVTGSVAVLLWREHRAR